MIPGINTGGGGLSNSSSAASRGGTVSSGSKTLSFAGPTVGSMQMPNVKTVAIYAGMALFAFVIYKKVMRHG